MSAKVREKKRIMEIALRAVFKRTGKGNKLEFGKEYTGVKGGKGAHGGEG